MLSASSSRCAICKADENSLTSVFSADAGVSGVSLTSASCGSGVAGKISTVTCTVEPWNTSCIISLSFCQSSWSRPHPTRGMLMRVTLLVSAWLFNANKGARKVLYVGL